MTSSHPSTAPSLDRALPELLRAARRRADLSQRALAAAAGVTRSRVARAEAGGGARWDVVLALLAACGLHAVVLDDEGVELRPVGAGWDGGGRRYPARLDPRVPAEFGDWWPDWPHQTWGRPPHPPRTYDLDRRRRDVRRRDPGAPRATHLWLVPPADAPADGTGTDEPG